MDDTWENEGGAVVAPENKHSCPYERECCDVCGIDDDSRYFARENGCCNHKIVPNG